VAAAASARASGNAHFAARSWAEAQAAYEAGLAAAPRCATLSANAAAAAQQLGDWAATARLAAHALSVQSRQHKARRRLAEALLALRRPLEAVPHFETLVALFPADEGLANALRGARAAAAAELR
jgi:tetratricopeptide (TPR) repeat protein